MDTTPKVTKASDTTFNLEAIQTLDAAEAQVASWQSLIDGATNDLSQSDRQLITVQSEHSKKLERLTELTKNLAYWQSVVDQAKAQGVIKVVDVASVSVAPVK